MIWIFNGLGLIFGVCALLLGLGVKSLFGLSSDAVPTILMGIVLAGLDIAYRAKKGGGDFADRKAGGSFFFLPAWVFGAFFFVAGIFSLFRGPE
ncbi:MAG TPA: hypothetical protein P5081_07850 [Phycisphaerae bacterium]|nr:hypothetical protein [Phycisphaerae bacterium]HRW52785.1 hypothetical protein [Phycisphaerae bacterium]